MNGAPPYIKDNEPAYEVSGWTLIPWGIGCAGILAALFFFGMVMGGAC